MEARVVEPARCVGQAGEMETVNLGSLLAASSFVQRADCEEDFWELGDHRVEFDVDVVAVDAGGDGVASVGLVGLGSGGEEDRDDGRGKLVDLLVGFQGADAHAVRLVAVPVHGDDAEIWVLCASVRDDPFVSLSYVARARVAWRSQAELEGWCHDPGRDEEVVHGVLAVVLPYLWNLVPVCLRVWLFG